MVRKIIQIDENKCNGCGACAAACHEGAIGMADGKAKLPVSYTHLDVYKRQAFPPAKRKGIKTCIRFHASFSG